MARITEAPPGVSAPDATASSPTAGSQRHPEIDWDAAAQSTEFRELVRRKRSFVLPALGFVFVWYFGFIALAGYAPDFMGESIYEGFTVGYALALSQFVMTWTLAWLYLRRADRAFDPLARRAGERALARAKDAARPADGGRRHGTPASAGRPSGVRR